MTDRLIGNDYNMTVLRDIDMATVEAAIKPLTHGEIKDFREALEKAGNKNYLLRSLWYDYSKQTWICPE